MRIFMQLCSERDAPDIQNVVSIFQVKIGVVLKMIQQNTAFMVCFSSVIVKPNPSRQHLHQSVDLITPPNTQGWGKMDFYPGGMTERCPAFANQCYELPAHITDQQAVNALWS